MGTYLGLLLVSMMLTAWVAFTRGRTGGPLDLARGLTEAAVYLVCLPVAVWFVGVDAVIRIGAVVLVFGGVYLAHRTIFTLARRIRRYRGTRDGSGGAGRDREGVAQ